MKIYLPNGEELLEVPVKSTAEHEQELMKSDFIRLEWSQDKKTILPCGSYIVYEKDNVKYRLFENYEPDEKDLGEFDYSPEFQHPIMWLGNVPFIHIDGDITSFDTADKETEWKYTGMAANLVQEKFVPYLNKVGEIITDIGTGWSAIVSTDITATADCSFSSMDFLSALNHAASQYECEWHLDYENRILYFGTVSIKTTDLTFEVGVNVNNASITQNKDGYYNAFLAKGSTRNISQVNDKGENIQLNKRLTLDPVKYPKGYIDVRENDEEPLLIKELIFEDIYPSMNLYVYNPRARTRNLLDNDGNTISDGKGGLKRYSVWYVRLAYKLNGEWKDFEIDEEMLLGTLSCQFQPNPTSTKYTSSLAGRTFELKYHKENISYPADEAKGDTGVEILAGDYEIIFDQSNDLIIPTTIEGGLYPKGDATPSEDGNILRLYNIAMSSEVMAQAQEELEKATLKEIDYYRSDRNNYSFNSNPIEFKKEMPELFLGREVNYRNGDYSYTTRIIKLVQKLDFDFEVEITVGNETIKGNTTTMREQLQILMSAYNTGSGGSMSVEDFRKMLNIYGGSMFLSKLNPDTANGLITFLRGLIAENKITARQGVDFGTFIAGLYGSGGNIDSMGRAELHSLFVRTSISAPKFVFNLVNVTKAEQWNTNGYGSIKSVDKDNRICELQLEDNEYGSLEVGDICRGIYADIDNAFGSDSNVEGAIDDCGFTVHQGFFTTYFYVEKVLESRKGVFKFRYGKRSETTPDPCAFMDFAQYGNFTNEERRASTYFSSRGKSYIEELGGVKTWEIQSENRVVRLGWLGNLQVKKKNGSWVQLKGNGLFVQDNIYFGGQPNFIDGLAELEDLKEMATAYDVSLSQYQSVLTVDDMGNVINGLYTEDEAKTTKQYRISTAVFVRKGTQILLEEDAGNENVTEGHYRLHVVSDDCDVEVRNSTFYVKGIKNIKDGVSGTEDDATFDYDAMRKMTDAMILVVVDLEGKTTKSVEMPIHIQHDSLPFMVCDVSNENASVSWNTKTKKYLGLPIKATVNLMYHNEPWKISECNVVSGVPEGLTATVALNENGKSYDITIDGNPADDTLPQVSNIVITFVGRYAGANYEYTKTLTINKSADNVIYEIVPSVDSIVIDKADNMTADMLTCDIYATSSDDKRYKLTVLPEGFTLKYGIDTDVPTTAMQINGTVNVSLGNNQVVFALYDKSGNVLDKESVPVLAYGKDGKRIEYVFKRTTNDEIPTISFPDKWETDPSYQQDDYVPSGWTDDPVGVNEVYLYEWVAIRKSVNGVWQPFGDVSEYAHFGKHAARAAVTDSLVTIPTDSLGNALESFSEDIYFSLLVDGLACSISSISTSNSLTNASYEISNYYGRVRISCNDNAALGKKTQTLNFKVVGTLNNASYQDNVTVKVIPNVTGEDGDGYEYVYYLSATEQTPGTPSRNGGALTSGWTEDVPALTETQRYVYVAWKRGEVGADGNFSTPKLFTYKAKDGVGEATAYCRSAIAPTIVPTVTSTDVFVNATPSANLGASLTHNDPANGSTIFTDGWDSIKSAATLNSFWRKAIPDAAVLNNVKANVDNSGGYWENFTLDGYGWWKSPKITNSETCMMKIKFTTTQANQVVTFVIRASSEARHDFGIIGKLDTEGVSSYIAKVSEDTLVTVPILVTTAKEHFVCVAYSKDGSSYSYNDCCYVRIATDELHQIKGIANSETIKWGTISEIKATKGDIGYGCVMRISLWSKGKQYVNESNMEGDGTKYIDCVYVEDTTANEGYRLYECRVSHSSDEHTYEETNYWRQLSDQGPIYTPLIVAKNAVFKFAQGQQFNITDDSGVVWGSFRHVTNDNDIALWLGATSGTDGSNASFSVTKGGKMTAIYAKISGEIEATSGKIGGFIIEETSIRSRKDAYIGGSGINSFGSSEFFLHSNGSNNAFCGFSATNKWSGIGLNTLPATAGFTALARFSDTTQDPDSWSLDSWTKIGVYLDISGAKTYDDVGKGNCAIYAKHGVYAGFRIGTRLTTKSLTLTDMDNLIVCYNTTEITITLPSGCEKGQVFFIRPAGTGIVTVAAETGKILRNGDNMGGGVSSDTLGGKWMHTFIYDKYNNVWLMSFSN